MLEEEKVYTSMYSRNAELYHHGIQGQKWGITNGPPYPLDSNISTGKRLRKAAKKEAKRGSKEYREKKATVKMLQNESWIKKAQSKEMHGKAKRALKKISKGYKMQYKQAKKELSMYKSNSKSSKQLIKDIENMKISDVANFLKDIGWNEGAITKLALKDYKSEHKDEYESNIN